MKRDGILLLSFPFISEGFSVEFIATKYGEIVSKLGIRDASSFTGIHNSLEDDKISVSYKE